MVNYNLGKVYKIVCNTTGLVYIGSTCEPTLARRLMKHRSNYKDYLNGSKNNITSFKILENNNYEIILIENCPCETKDELHKQERIHIESNVCVNKHIPCRTRNEYCEDNKIEISKKMKIYKDNNKEDFKEKRKIRDNKNKEANKQKISEQCKLYYDKNKEKIKAQAKLYREKKKQEKIQPETPI